MRNMRIQGPASPSQKPSGRQESWTERKPRSGCGIMILGVIAFGIGTVGGLFMAKIMNLFVKEKVNPLIGSAVAAGILFRMLGS